MVAEYSVSVGPAENVRTLGTSAANKTKSAIYHPLCIGPRNFLRRHKITVLGIKLPRFKSLFFYLLAL